MVRSLPELLLLIHLVATPFMTGVIWFVQPAHYPLFSALGRSEFTACARQHTAQATRSVATPMLVL
jgi:hypothetical protein